MDSSPGGSRYDALADVPPDQKDWTWTLRERCPECGFDAGSVQPGRIGDLARAAAGRYAGLGDRDPAALARRPAPAVWSPLEYLCHVRDVCTLFDHRARLMLGADHPSFPDWDQDVTALQSRYADQSPPVVLTELAHAASAIADTYDGVSEGQWSRTGVRSNGSEFTVLTLGQYFLHDLYHHLHDVSA